MRHIASRCAHSWLAHQEGTVRGKIGKPELSEPPVEPLADEPADFAVAGPAQSELRQAPFQEIYSRIVWHKPVSIGFPLENAAMRRVDRRLAALKDRAAQRTGTISRAAFKAFIINNFVDLPKLRERAFFRHIHSLGDCVVDMGLQSGLHLQMSADREVAGGHKGTRQTFVVVPELAPEF